MLLAARSPLAPALTQTDQAVAAPRRWHVLAAFPTALYARHARAGVLAVVTSDGLALPTAWRLPIPSSTVRWGVVAGDQIVTTPDQIHLPHSTIRAVRAWRPARVRRAGEARVALPSRWYADRIGRGSGLTPQGDDEICGALLVAAALGDPQPRTLAERLLSRTTSLSAALVTAAASGYAVPAVVSYVDAILGGTAEDADRLRADVAAIGHTSGAGLLRGIDLALAARDTPGPSEGRDHTAYDHDHPFSPKEPVRA